jgi:hypothetical protein
MISYSLRCIGRESKFICERRGQVDEEDTRDAKVYGLQRPMNRGYRQHVRTECCLQIHAMNRSKPRPYPPWGDVPYLEMLLELGCAEGGVNLLSLLGVPVVLLR